jgi:hypothetical protein
MLRGRDPQDQEVWESHFFIVGSCNLIAHARTITCDPVLLHTAQPLKLVGFDAVLENCKSICYFIN